MGNESFMAKSSGQILAAGLFSSCGDFNTKNYKIMQRPTSVTVFGILNIVFAVFGICGVVGIVTMFMMMGMNLNNPAFQNNPTMQAIQDSPVYAAWLKISVVLGLAASSVLLAAGIGLLKLKPWARMLSIAYSIYGIISLIIGTAVNYIFLVQPMLEKVHVDQGPEAAGAIGGAIGGMFGGCIGIIYPVLLLIFMTRPKVTAAFRPQSPEAFQPPPIP